MDKIVKILIIIFPCLIFSQNEFNNGYKEGYKSGYCYEQGNGCIPPIPPVPPIPRVGESTYTDGYNRGFSDGKNNRSSKSTDSNSSTQSSRVPSYSTSSFSPLSMDEAIMLSMAKNQNKNSESNNDGDLFANIILLPFKMILDWDEISISPAFAFSNPNNKSFKSGYGFNIDGRFGDNRVDFVYGYSFIHYNQIEKNETNVNQHTANIGIGINILTNRSIQLELTPLLEYELNNKSDFGYGGYFGFKILSPSKKITIGSRYRYTTVSNQISANLIYIP